MSTLIATPPLPRRSGNYQPSMWKDDFLQSLSTNYTGTHFNEQVDELKLKVKHMLNVDLTSNILDQLEAVDDLQRLGISYHFYDEIKSILEKIHKGNNYVTENLYVTALAFRLLRQHGHDISQDVFKNFTENGNFRECLSCKDAKALLSLYEACFFSYDGESLLEAARCFTSKTLEKYVKDIANQSLNIKVRHALELPLNWRMPRLEARWYIDLYEKSNNMNPTLLELAKLDYNIVQGLYQEELKIVTRWWRDLGLSNQLKFSRDRMVESYIWTVGIIYEPQYRYCRLRSAKQIQLISLIDDIYDVYGTLDELEIFTDAIKRWDINAIQHLPDYMKICFLALFNFVNETVYDIFREQKIIVLPHLKKNVG